MFLLINFLLFFFLPLQLTYTLAAVWHHLWCTGWSELSGHGLFHNDIVYDVAICRYVNCLLPLAHEQRFRFYNVFVIFCFRCRFVNVRIWCNNMSSVKCYKRSCRRRRKQKKQPEHNRMKQKNSEQKKTTRTLYTKLKQKRRKHKYISKIWKKSEEKWL